MILQKITIFRYLACCSGVPHGCLASLWFTTRDGQSGSASARTLGLATNLRAWKQSSCHRGGIARRVPGSTFTKPLRMKAYNA